MLLTMDIISEFIPVLTFQTVFINCSVMETGIQMFSEIAFFNYTRQNIYSQWCQQGYIL